MDWPQFFHAFSNFIAVAAVMTGLLILSSPGHGHSNSRLPRS